MAKKKAAKKSKTQELVPMDTKTQALVSAMFEDDAGGGFENADQDCFAIPYLVILQKGSPQCDTDEGAYVKGAKPGMLFNNVTEELFDTEKGVEVIPVTMTKAFVEWGPREAGGGFRGSYRPGDKIVQEARANRDESGRLLLENGNYLADTRYHFCLLRSKTGAWIPIVISMTSTQIKKSRSWMTTMQNIQFERQNGELYTAPMYSHIYRITTRAENNEKGNWKGWVVALERRLNPVAEAEDRRLVLSARLFKKQLEDGAAQIVQVDEDPNAAGTSEVPDF